MEGNNRNDLEFLIYVVLSELTACMLTRASCAVTPCPLNSDINYVWGLIHKPLNFLQMTEEKDADVSVH